LAWLAQDGLLDDDPWSIDANKELSPEELVCLEKEVTDDLRFDYDEDELDLWFDDQSVEGVLRICVQDHEFLEEDDENESEK